MAIPRISQLLNKKSLVFIQDKTQQVKAMMPMTNSNSMLEYNPKLGLMI